MKLNVSEINEKFEEEIKRRIDVHEKNRNEQLAKIEMIEKKNFELNEKMKNLKIIKKQSKAIKNQLNDIFQEKVELEEIVFSAGRKN